MGDPWINAIIGMWLYKKGELIMAMKDERLQVLLSERKVISDTRESLRKDMMAMDVVIESYCKRNNVCVHCEGTGEFYVDSSADGDPNHRSSDDRHNCSQCHGTGKYKGGK